MITKKSRTKLFFSAYIWVGMSFVAAMPTYGASFNVNDERPVIYNGMDDPFERMSQAVIYWAIDMASNDEIAAAGCRFSKVNGEYINSWGTTDRISTYDYESNRKVRMYLYSNKSSWSRIISAKTYFDINCNRTPQVIPRVRTCIVDAGYNTACSPYRPIFGWRPPKRATVEINEFNNLKIKVGTCSWKELFIQKPDEVIVKVIKPPYIKDGIIDVRITGTNWQDMSMSTKMKICGLKAGRGEDSMILQMQYR